MKSIFKKTSSGQELILNIEGMHCPSCAMVLDFAIEKETGVYSVKTSYAKSTIKVEYNLHKIDKKRLIEVIEKQGYQVVD